LSKNLVRAPGTLAGAITIPIGAGNAVGRLQAAEAPEKSAKLLDGAVREPADVL